MSSSHTVSDTTRLDAAFEDFLTVPYPPNVVTERQRIWCAFEAGAQWALAEVQRAASNRTDEQRA